MPLPPGAVGGPINNQAPTAGWNRTLWIGEAAGRNEVKEGIPFVGEAGQLHDEALAAAGIRRDQCWTANVFRYRPENNDIDLFFAAPNAGVDINTKLPPRNKTFVRIPYDAEVRYLWQLIRSIRPRMIITLGGIPLWALTGKTSSTRERGKLHETQALAGVPVFSTLHPSYCLHKPSEKPVYIDDISNILASIERQFGCDRHIDWSLYDDPSTGYIGTAEQGRALARYDQILAARKALRQAAATR